MLEARGLTKRYGDVRAVNDVTFALRRGEICGLLGPNGAGKSTTIRMMLGLVRPDAGSTRILDATIAAGAPVLSRVGAIVEDAAFYPFLSGRRNLQLWQRMAGRRDPAAIRRALEVAELGSAADRRVKTYSHGMRQRLGIARALMERPDVLVLDEPATGLDPSGIRAVRGLLEAAAHAGAAILLSSHLLAEVELLCTSVVVMRAGAVVARADLSDLLAARTSVFDVEDADAAATLLARAGFAAERAGDGRLSVRHEGRARADVVRLLVEGGVAVEGAGPGRSLEDVFLALTGDRNALS